MNDNSEKYLIDYFLAPTLFCFLLPCIITDPDISPLKLNTTDSLTLFSFTRSVAVVGASQSSRRPFLLPLHLVDMKYTGCIFSLVYVLGAVHILRQLLEGGEGVSQKLTITDEGGEGGKPNAGDAKSG